MLELKSISKYYNVGRQTITAIKNVSINFRSNEFVCIIGPSGCGKTTLLNIIGGLDNYSGGEMKICGKTTKNYRSNDWDGYRNKTIGFVFQNYNLIPQLTVYENVELALSLSGIKKIFRKEKIIKTLTNVGLKNEIYKYPNQLSGGQMQRVAIARAIINDPDIILADEPTGALDSSTAEQIVSLLKEISKHHLVIMVTHNQQLAKSFATRIITLSDGKVIHDTNPYYRFSKDLEYKGHKTAISFASAVKLSFKNLITKKLRTILIILAGSVGIISVTLVLTISSGVNHYLDDIQKVILQNEPIRIYREYSYDNPYEEEIDLEKYPDSDIIPIIKENRSYYSDVNNLSNDFVNYLEKLDPNLYNFINYQRKIQLNIYTKNQNNVIQLSNSSFTEISSNYQFISEQYDLLWGELPTEADELALLINIDNSLDAKVLYELGIDYKNHDQYTFADITQKEYKIILNDDLYVRDENGLFKKNTNFLEIYNNGFPLKITGIIRPSKNNNISLYDSGILYTEKLTNFIIEDSLKSEIVIEQLKYGLNMNVMTGLPFEDSESVYSIRTKEYLYELQLINLCVKSQIFSIRIYTDSFSSRNTINDYLKQYNDNQKQENKIRYYDYIGNISREFDTFVNILTKVLIIFSCVALLVSTIMIGIITYVSVMERIKEIGILRSLGARKIDIANVFNAETGLIGFTSGILGVLLGIVLIKPIVKIITQILEQNNITTFDLTQMNISKSNPLLIVLIIIANIILTLTAGIVPAILASLKSPAEAIRNE